MTENEFPRQLATALRVMSMDAVQSANSGHPGMPMGMADVAAILFSEYLRFDATAPRWHDRDRFVLSAGHGSMLLYAILHLMGYDKPSMEDIRRFRQSGSPCAGHPENFEMPGIEATTGPLGQGLAMAVGMAIAERHMNAHFGDELVDHRTWVIAGDGCLMEGINHEAAGLAGHMKLNRLVVLWDDNRITIDGPVSLSSSEDVVARYTAYGWHVVECDGHDFDSIRGALKQASVSDRPALVRCSTTIGFGAPNMAGTEQVHGSPLGDEEVAAARTKLGWSYAPFDLPVDLVTAARAVGKRGASERMAWEARLALQADAAEFERRMDARLPGDFSLAAHVSELLADPKKVATRKASELALETITNALPETIGGSADLTPSNNTKTSALQPLTAGAYGGRYMRYGIREFGMAAAMNGMALHGGVIPYGGTFLVFSDYCRAAIRLSALQRQRVIYVMTHDSIGLGEDGPTHQPVEHVMGLRGIPNLNVFRPADCIETAECWDLALRSPDRPSVIALSRQDLPQLRSDASENWCAKGGYRLKMGNCARNVVLLATGSEVSLAVETAKILEVAGIGADIVSMPSWRHFDEQPPAYRADLLPANMLKVSIEAGITLGWERYTGVDGLRFGIDDFGRSGPAPEVYGHFGLTPSAISDKIQHALA